MKTMKTIKSEVNEFFGAKRICYATPGTDNHSANFYGDHYICKLTRSDVIGCIETARDNWCWPFDENGEEQAAIEAILGELQFDIPE